MIEPANTLDQLNPSYPRNVDLIKEGDDHIRLIKQVLKTTFPNINKVVTMSADKLNNLDKTFSATDANGNVTINGAVTMAANKTMNCGNNRLQNVSNPVAAQDAVTLAYFNSPTGKGQAWPVNSVFITAVNINPADARMLGFGTWIPISAGRYLAGTGTDNDGRSSRAIYEGRDAQNRNGKYTSILNVNNVPHHTHPAGDLNTGVAGNHTHPYRDRYYVEAETTVWSAPYREAIPGGAGYNRGFGSKGTDNDNDRWLFYDTNTSASGNHNHPIGGNTGGVNGGGQTPFETLPPAFGVYIWRRTA